jgi:hypothetical protein
MTDSQRANAIEPGIDDSPDISGVPKVRELYEAVYFGGLRELGVPEE